MAKKKNVTETEDKELKTTSKKNKKAVKAAEIVEDEKHEEPIDVAVIEEPTETVAEPLEPIVEDISSKSVVDMTDIDESLQELNAEIEETKKKLEEKPV